MTKGGSVMALATPRDLATTKCQDGGKRRRNCPSCGLFDDRHHPPTTATTNDGPRRACAATRRSQQCSPLQLGRADRCATASRSSRT